MELMYISDTKGLQPMQSNNIITAELQWKTHFFLPRYNAWGRTKQYQGGVHFNLALGTNWGVKVCKVSVFPGVLN